MPAKKTTKSKKSSKDFWMPKEEYSKYIDAFEAFERTHWEERAKAGSIPKNKIYDATTIGRIWIAKRVKK
jgi:hypothetical protein